MSKNSNNASKGGVGFECLLQIAFIVLKLCKVINWSWFWVLSPTWISIGLVVLFAIFIAVIGSRK